jgi:hypothetical protein
MPGSSHFLFKLYFNQSINQSMQETFDAWKAATRGDLTTLKLIAENDPNKLEVSNIATSHSEFAWCTQRNW